VDNALETIENVVDNNPDFHHYMFAPDDVSYNGTFFKNCSSKVLYYEDFLRGDVTTGFIHCMATDVVKRHPFDEMVRIHEGVFFLSFYRDIRKMLFTNKVVTVRERGRSDSVTLDSVRTSKELIRRGIKANEMMLERFGEDMRRNDCRKEIERLYCYLFDNYLLTSEYDGIGRLNRLYITRYSKYIPRTRKLMILRTIYHFHLGIVYWWMLRVYLLVKYRVFKYKTK